MNPRIVVLGSTGFVGSMLLERLRNYEGLQWSGFSSSELNLASPCASDQLTKQIDSDTVLISCVRSRPQYDLLDTYSEENLININLAKSLSNQRIRKCIYFSTLSVYGDSETDLCISENTMPRQTSLYGISKFSGEYLLQEASQKAGTPLIILRPCKIYGPGDKSNAYGPAKFIKSIIRDNQVSLFGPGKELRDHLFINDLIDIVLRLALGKQTGIYNVASGSSQSFLEMIAILKEIASSSFGVCHVERDNPPIDQRIDISKLLDSLPGITFTELKSGLYQTYQYILRQPC